MEERKERIAALVKELFSVAIIETSNGLDLSIARLKAAIAWRRGDIKVISTPRQCAP